MKILIPLLLLFIGCAPKCVEVYWTYTQPQIDYIDKVMGQPTTFAVHRNESNDVWGRAQAFIAKHAGMKIEFSGENALYTYSTHLPWIFGYTITRSPLPNDQVEFFVASYQNGCSLDKVRRFNHADLNAHIAAHYMRTAETIPDSVVVH